MTDNEIIKALECCHGEYSPDCDNCPNENTCGDINVTDSALGLINRQKAQIARLEIELKAMRGAANSYKKWYHETKFKAIKEFAERFENALDKRLGEDIPICGDRDNVYCVVSDIYDVINNLAKEMTEAENEREKIY